MNLIRSAISWLLIGVAGLLIVLAPVAAAAVGVFQIVLLVRGIRAGDIGQAFWTLLLGMPVIGLAWGALAILAAGVGWLGGMIDPESGLQWVGRSDLGQLENERDASARSRDED